MSATNRGRARNARDFYETPEWVTGSLLSVEALPTPIFDPCCGTGAMLRVLSRGREASGADIHPESVNEARSNTLDVSVADFLAIEHQKKRRGSVVMNPPYRQAAEFVRAALRGWEPGSRVAALLRLNFLGSSRKRIDLVGPGSCLRAVHVLSRRPSFTGDGRTDACEYAWFVWEVGYTGGSTLTVIGGK